MSFRDLSNEELVSYRDDALEFFGKKETAAGGQSLQAASDELFFRLERGQQWQPIETAPKDGKEFLVRYNNQGGVLELVSWNKIHKHWQSKGVAIVFLQATHWVNIPIFKEDQGE